MNHSEQHTVDHATLGVFEVSGHPLAHESVNELATANLGVGDEVSLYDRSNHGLAIGHVEE